MNSGFLSPKKILVLHGEWYLSAEPHDSLNGGSAGWGCASRNPCKTAASVVHVIPEQVLLNVGHAEEHHSEQVHQHADDRKDIVLGNVAIVLAALLCQEAHEGDGIEAAEETPITLVVEHAARHFVGDKDMHSTPPDYKRYAKIP